MASTKSSQIGLIYGEKSGILRRIVEPDFDLQLQEPNGCARIGPGETLLVVNKTDHRWENSNEGADADLCQAIVEGHIGRKARSNRVCKMNKNGVVEAIISADVEIDAHPDDLECELIQHDTAQPGWHKVGKTLKKPG